MRAHAEVHTASRHVNAHAHAHVRTCTHADRHARTYARAHTLTCTHARILTHTHARPRAHRQTHARAHKHACTRPSSQTRMHACTHVRTHARARARAHVILRDESRLCAGRTYITPNPQDTPSFCPAVPPSRGVCMSARVQAHTHTWICTLNKQGGIARARAC